MFAGVEARDGARAELAATVAQLQRAVAYAEKTAVVETIETHMSFVFLTEAHAYKLKKPLRTALLDYTTRAARRRACATEVELNRRLAPRVYLGVVPVVRAHGELFVDRSGEPVDWLVKMRRLPRDLMLDACIAQRSVGVVDIARLAATLVRFYARAEAVRLPGPAYRERHSSDMADKHRSLRQPRYGLDRECLQTVVEGQLRWLARHGALLEARASAVVDAHGDLRPEHICLAGRAPLVIDCLEFSRDLRRLDPVSELSFLALECRRLGDAWIGPQLLSTYQELADDAVAQTLIAFYQRHHALVRAAVAVWHLDDATVDDAGKWRARGNNYLRIASELL